MTNPPHPHVAVDLPTGAMALEVAKNLARIEMVACDHKLVEYFSTFLSTDADDKQRTQMILAIAWAHLYSAARTIHSIETSPLKPAPVDEKTLEEMVATFRRIASGG